MFYVHRYETANPFSFRKGRTPFIRNAYNKHYQICKLENNSADHGDGSSGCFFRKTVLKFFLTLSQGFDNFIQLNKSGGFRRDSITVLGKDWIKQLNCAWMDITVTLFMRTNLTRRPDDPNCHEETLPVEWFLKHIRIF